MSPASTNPGGYFAEHTGAYAASLVGAGTAVSIFAARAAQASGLKRVGWALLFLLEAAIFIGIVVSRGSATRG